jgi:hypothetical protein
VEYETSTGWDSTEVGEHQLVLGCSVATAIAGVFAIFANKMDTITDKLEDVDEVKSRGVSCHH